MQLSDRNEEESEMDAAEEDQSEIEYILKQTANSINAFKNSLEDERDTSAIEEAKKVAAFFVVKRC